MGKERVRLNAPRGARLRHRSLESRLEIERLTSGLEGGCWKSACDGNSLAAYLTACTVLQTSGGSDPFAEFNNSHQPTRQRERHMQRVKSPLRPTIPLSLRPYCPTLPPTPPSVGRSRISPGDAETIRELARDHESLLGCLRKTSCQFLPLTAVIESANKLTKPAGYLGAAPT